jgi:hypothetical protein
MFAKLSNHISGLNAALLAGSAAHTCQLSGLLEIRQNEEGKFLADPLADRRESITDRVYISGLNIFLNEIQFEPVGGAGDGHRYGQSVKMAFVGYCDQHAGDVCSFVVGQLAARQGVTLQGATFDADEINSKYLFLEELPNHDRRLFAIAYDFRFTLDPRRDCVKSL